MKYGNKELRVVTAPLGNHYVLQFTTGGELPAAFQGMFTSQSAAWQAVTNYEKVAKEPAKVS